MSEPAPATAEDALADARAQLRAGRFAEAERLAAAAVGRFPAAAELWNLIAAARRRLGRNAEAFEAADRAVALKPDLAAARVNRGAALVELGRQAEGLADLRAATELEPGLAAAWLHLAQALAAVDGAAAAEAALDEGLRRNPDNLGLLEGKAVTLRTSDQAARAEAFLRQIEPRFADVAWVQLYLGDLEAEHDPAAGERRIRRARELDPQGAGPVIALVQRLARVTGAEEGRALDEAAGLARQALGAGARSAEETKVLRDGFSRVCDFEAMERLGDFRTAGRRWAQAGLHTALFRHLPRVAGEADRRELLEQHRIAAARLEAEAARRPIRRPAPRAPGKVIRLGFLSSDLRGHPVGYFVEPLFWRLDPARFEVFCYGFDRGPADALQGFFQARATAFRRMPELSAREAAQAIADDDLDVLIELGGSTSGNRLEVMAYRPAPKQASWLGYPHSAGLAAIDGLICDPFNVPPDDGLLLERPLVMPRSWIALGPATFKDEPAVEPLPAEARNGALTFGTANNPYKYTPAGLRTWAEITAAASGARFAFIRPEGASAAFRANVLRVFEAAGVPAERVLFHAVRGAHLPWYNKVDISLDTFPLTGGTTTTEALWMGVPVVSLKGPAFFERLSWSILANAGLPDLAADDLDGFRKIALDLAADPARRAELRAGMRARLRASPLGDTEGFARDFFDLIERFVRGA
jgi:predicted O-linked N-acetylglucosamine transferase (SPINDLY family)